MLNGKPKKEGVKVYVKDQIKTAKSNRRVNGQESRMIPKLTISTKSKQTRVFAHVNKHGCPE